MFKLLKNMRGREIAMAAVCLLFVVGQVYFDLLLPDYMTELTTLIKTSGTTKAIANVGLKMLGEMPEHPIFLCQLQRPIL